jgi:hypothetical protein
MNPTSNNGIVSGKLKEKKKILQLNNEKTAQLKHDQSFEWNFSTEDIQIAINV